MQNYSSNVTDSAGNAVAYALITIFNADGTLATLYSNSTGTASLPNPFPADALGRFNFFAANGKYKGTYAGNGILGFSFQFELYDPTDSTGAASIGYGTDTVAGALDSLHLADYTALRAYAGAQKSVYVTGYLGTAAPSGIAGMFVRDDSDTTTADNGGTVIVASSGKRWKRQFDGRRVNVTWFGAKLNGTADDWASCQAAINSINPYTYTASFNYRQGGGEVLIPRGICLLGKTLYIPDHVVLVGEGSQPYQAQDNPAGTPDGTIIMPVASGFVGVAVLDSSGYVLATGARYTSATPLSAGDFDNHIVSYTEGCGARDIAIQPNGTTGLIGARFQGSPGAKVHNLSAEGFAVGIQGICCWNSDFENLFTAGSKQIGGYFKTCNSAKITGNFDCSVVNGAGNGVTSANKPACWDSIDTVYASTSLYLISNMGLEMPSICTQHTARGIYCNGSYPNIGTWYVEDMTLANPADANYIAGTAMLNANNGSVSTTPSAYPDTASTPNIVIANLMSTANGATFADSIYNANILLLALSQPSGGAGVGTLFGANTSTGQSLYVGPGVQRNFNYGDYNFDARIQSIVTEEGTWTPSLTNIGGTVSSVVGKWIKRGRHYECIVNISGTGLTATGGLATVISTPFNGTGGLGAPARKSPGVVTTANLQAGSALMDVNANLYVSAITSTTAIAVAFNVFTN